MARLGWNLKVQERGGFGNHVKAGGVSLRSRYCGWGDYCIIGNDGKNAWDVSGSWNLGERE